MKFREMTYTRPDIDALLARCKELAAKAESAASGEALVAVYYEQSRAFADYNTAANLASIHYTCDTRDAAWKAEQDFFDANGPAVQNASVEISRAFLANPHRYRVRSLPATGALIRTEDEGEQLTLL